MIHAVEIIKDTGKKKVGQIRKIATEKIFQKLDRILEC